MNLRNASEYNIGLDLGTGSVGWAVTDKEGKLYSFKSKPSWGSRLFPQAETAAATRTARGQRRRYIRRRWRLNLLQGIFSDEMEKIDPELFIRMNQSQLLKEDRKYGVQNYLFPLFNDTEFTDRDYYQKFPTIYHLRAHLVHTAEKEDLRLVYLALHNIVKYRGNFLHQEDKKLSAKNANTHESVTRMCNALEEWCTINNINCSVTNHSEEIESLLEESSISRSYKQSEIEKLIAIDKGENEFANPKKMSQAISKLIVGYKADPAVVFFTENTVGSFALSDEEKPEEFLEKCPDEGIELFESLQGVYSVFVLMGILKGADGTKTISDYKVEEYEKYGEDLRLLKSVFRKYAPESYDHFFRGAQYPGTNKYSVEEAYGYTRYNLGTRKLSYDDFAKLVTKELENTDAVNDERYTEILEGFSEGSFLRRLKTSDNGVIPYQLHLEEALQIIDNQSQYYAFLAEAREKIEKIISFRIPYYVGPLQTKNAAKDASGKNRFAWSVRQEGTEDIAITPWNWEQIIDKTASAEAFMYRMIGTCTYLIDEPVLPKCSLLYEEYCLLNELNGAKWTQDGDFQAKFDYSDRMDIVDTLFKKQKTVSYKKVAEWMTQSRHHMNVHVSGGQGENGFESKLSSYLFFCKDIFEIEELPESYIEPIEEIILWNTLFEDRTILKEKIVEKYGPSGTGKAGFLNEVQIQKICKKRFTGWGKLSKKLLTGVRSEIDGRQMSILDILREGNPNNSARGNALVFMQIITDDSLGFKDQIDEFNKEKVAENKILLSEMPGSPALRRSINQAIRIVDEVVQITGKNPKNIFVEVTREERASNKGRTKKRYEEIKQAFECFKQEDKDVWNELCQCNPNDIDEKLMLYFVQRGKSLYSGKSIRIEDLHLCEIDHIIPRCYIKDDSIENKALVYREENQRKLDSLTLDFDALQKRAFLPLRQYWKSLFDAKLIGEKKYNNLLREKISDKALKGFIARQIVETSQAIKLAQLFLQERYQDANIVPVKAAISSEIRRRKDFVKCRELNDYHHAHDAYLASEVGRFIQLRHPSIYENPLGLSHVIKKFVKEQAECLKVNRKYPGSSVFIVESFLRSSGFDKDTGEIFDNKVFWDADAECARIRRYLSMNDCYISRMPEETSGQFWDATIYSPRNEKVGSSLSLPIKEYLSTEKYGGFSSEKFAFFFVYEAINKKGVHQAFLEPVPVRVANKTKTNSAFIEEYAREICEKNECIFVRIIRERLLKYQVLEFGGNRFYLTGAAEVRNAKQISLGQKVNKTIALCSEQEKSEVTSDDLDLAYTTIAQKVNKYAPRVEKSLLLTERKENFLKLSVEEKAEILLRVISLINADRNMIDITKIGGSKNSGCLKCNFSNELSGTNVVKCVDSSVTGMYESLQIISL